MNDHSDVPASRSFGEDDIPSIMVDRSGEILTPAEIAVVALTLLETTSSSLDTTPLPLSGRWLFAATLGALRGNAG